jgi:periplasmic protein TonB
MMNRIAFRRLVPVTASLLIHLGIVGVIVLGPGWAPIRMPVLIAELVQAEAPPDVTPPAPMPIVRDRRPITPPKPIAAPLPPEIPAAARPEPEPPKPVVPQPPTGATEPPKPIAPEPSPAATPEPEASRLAVSDPVQTPTLPGTAAPPISADGRPEPSAVDPIPGAFAAPPSTSPGSSSGPSAARGPVVAAIPPDGVTRRAIPRGGYQYRPAYPSSARSLGIQGTTLLHVLVSDSGRVAEVVVKQSAGHPDLDRAAADAVRRWRFEPARRGSDPVEMWVQLPFEFRLR